MNAPLFHAKMSKVIQSPIDDDQAANQPNPGRISGSTGYAGYAAAEEQVKLRFGAVDSSISLTTGLPFAENAVASGVG